MDNSPRSNGPQVFSTEVGENKIDYKQRCKYLENQLEKFREQAAKVREVIGQKVRNTLECFVSCCRFMHAAIEFAESYPCKSVLFVSLLLFSLFSSRFRTMLELSQKKSSAGPGLQVNCMSECLLCLATDMNWPAWFSEVCIPYHLSTFYLERRRFWTFVWT